MTDKMTPEELRDEVLAVFRVITEYWANLPDHDKATGRDITIKDRCEGVAFSMLAQLDGVGHLPAFDLVARVHPDDGDPRIDRVAISDMLHEHFHKTP